jgi:hypothetical protein
MRLRFFGGDFDEPPQSIVNVQANAARLGSDITSAHDTLAAAPGLRPSVTSSDPPFPLTSTPHHAVFSIEWPVMNARAAREPPPSVT